MREPQFNFVPVELVREAKEKDGIMYRVTITANDQLYFPAETVNIFDLANRILKFFIDEQKKILGWTVMAESYTDISEFKITASMTNPYRKVALTPQGVASIAIKRFLNLLNIQTGVTRSKLPVRMYVDQKNRRDIYYIELNDSQYAKKKEVVGNTVSTETIEVTEDKEDSRQNPNETQFYGLEE